MSDIERFKSLSKAIENTKIQLGTLTGEINSLKKQLLKFFKTEKGARKRLPKLRGEISLNKKALHQALIRLEKKYFGGQRGE